MYEFALVWDWLSFAVRWLHIITVIAWIGSSFYFIALDLGLRKNPDLPKGIYGEAWQVHGGGFYLPYLIIEFIVTCHKSNFTEKYKGCQIICKRG